MLVLILSTQAKAQYANTHYIAPSPWQYFNKYNELVITTLSNSAVSVTISSSNGTVYSNSLTTVAGSPLRYRFAGADAVVNASGTILNGQGLIVSGTAAISVQVRNIASDNYTIAGSAAGDLNACVQKGNSAFTSLGDQGLGTSFRIGYYANVTGGSCYNEGGAPIYAVMAINNSTTVSLNGTTLVTLNAGQSYMFTATLGSLVTANNRIVVNAGMRVDNSSGCGDGVESQVMPISYLGTTYVVVRSNGVAGYERTTIVATQPNTTVTVLVPSTNTTANYTLTSAGSYITINNGDGLTAYTTSYITTSNPVAVYTGSADGCEIDMIVQPPLSSCAGSYDVQTNQFLNNTNGSNSLFPYFGYIILQSSSALVYMNGTNIETLTSARTQIGTTGYYIIRFTNSQLSNPANLRFTSTARMNIAFIESGAGYSMSSYISSTTSTMPPPSFTSSCNPSLFTAQSGFSSYQWYNNGVAISGATSQTYSALSNGNYTVTGTVASCGTTPQSSVITINAKPNAGIDQTICAGNSVTLIGSPTSGTTWTSFSANPTGATLGNTTNGVATASFAATASGNYNFVFSAGCTDTMQVTVFPLPTVAPIIGSNITFVGGTTTLTNATINGVWSSSNTSVVTITNSGIVTGLNVGSTTITYTVTNANSCSSSVTNIVTVNPQPNG
ncbi:MAG: Ig-like domain-containing protein [Chitinophagaceae bacterium]